jgi:hypothetical protein
MGLESNGTYELLVYADGVVNTLGGNMHSIKKNTEDLTDVSMEIGLEIIQTKLSVRTRIVTSRHQNAGQVVILT